MPGLHHSKTIRKIGFSQFIVLSLTILCLTIWNCKNPFAPKLIETGSAGGLIVTEQKNPEEVLQNFRYAYIFKDSLLYSELLDSSFVFVYFDPNIGTAGQFVSWGRTTDLKTTGKLFRKFDVIDLVWNSTISESVQETTGEVIKSFNLTLLTNDEDIHISGIAVFSFRKKSLSEKWRIVKWKDESRI